MDDKQVNVVIINGEAIELHADEILTEETLLELTDCAGGEE